MAVILIGRATSLSIKEYIGKSTDTKPKVDAGSTFYELDTKKGFISDGETWWEL